MKPGPWRDITVGVIVAFALLVMLICFHRGTELGKGLSVDGYALVGTTLFAAALGFGAVMLQLRDQHRSAEAGRGAQRRAIAKALLFEVDDFYSNNLKGVYDHYRDFDGKMEHLPGVTGTDFRALPVYEGSTASLGILPDEVVKSVVVFYDTARRHLSIARDYRELLREYLYGSHSPEAGQEALQLFSYVTGSIPPLTSLCYEACMRLAGFSGVPFRKDVLTVAGEDREKLLRDEQAEAKKHAEHRPPLHN